MKKFTKKGVMTGIAVMVSVYAFYNNASADTLEEYTAAIHSIEEAFDNIFESLGNGLKKDAVLSVGEIKKAAEQIEKQAESIEAIGKKISSHDFIFEADELAEAVEKFTEALEKNEFDEAVFHLTRSFNSFNLLQTVYPAHSRKRLSKEFIQLKERVTAGNLVQTEIFAEKIETVARHIHYASKMFGKKVWLKFAHQTLEAADDLADACDKNDKPGAEAAMAKLEKSIKFLEKLIK
ncbi:MAG: hypothetical protein GY749_23685 [Desulfobacteraceae bacterium]|nr:hypothetical protein [Desulfobacteraceae bacterium]